MTNYHIERMDVSRGSWIDVDTTSSLSYKVTKLDALKQYHFRVKAVNSEGESEPLQSDKPTLAKNPYGTL